LELELVLSFKTIKVARVQLQNGQYLGKFIYGGSSYL
jgi:hypothetical protein